MVAIVEIELRNTVAPLRSHIMSSSVRVMCLSRWIAVLGMRMSTHMRTSFGDFGFGQLLLAIPTELDHQPFRLYQDLLA